jgi:hypothetical protein
LVHVIRNGSNRVLPAAHDCIVITTCIRLKLRAELQTVKSNIPRQSVQTLSSPHQTRDPPPMCQ